MNNKVLFYELQRIRRLWVWLVAILVNVFPFYGIYHQIIIGVPFGTKPMSNIGLLIMAGFSIFFTLLFYHWRLITLIKPDGIYARFYPFQFSMKFYRWESIKSLNIRKYKPIREFQGWGLRYNFAGKGGRAFTVSGNIGLQIEFTNGNRLLIGTQKPKQIEEVLTKLGKLTTDSNN
jgi:hypothetical protein